MLSLEVRPFSDDDLEAAGKLLAERHRRHRAAEPLLSERFEDAAAAQAEVEAAWREGGAAGAAAFREGRLVGYLVGAPAADPRWGANGWIAASGHAVEEAEVVRDLYAAVAERWLEEGRSRHYVLTPRVAGLFEVAPIELSSMHRGVARPGGACYLAFAVTRPELRGSGAGLVLTNAAFAWAHAAGYATMVTDWRVTNLLSSRFWPRRGFRLSFLRLYRSIP